MYKEALKPFQWSCCSFAQVDGKSRTTSSCSTQAAPRQEDAQLQLSPMARDTWKPSQKGLQPSLLCLENTYAKDCSRIKGNTSPVGATLFSSFRVMPRHNKVTQPELTLPYAILNQEALLCYELFFQNCRSQVPAAFTAQCSPDIGYRFYTRRTSHLVPLNWKRLVVNLQVSPRKNGRKVGLAFHNRESLARVCHREKNGLSRWGVLCGSILWST